MLWKLQPPMLGMQLKSLVLVGCRFNFDALSVRIAKTSLQEKGRRMLNRTASAFLKWL